MDPYQQPQVITGMHGMSPSYTLKISKFCLIGIPYGYQPMIRRAYTINSLNEQNIRHIQNLFTEDRQTGGKINPVTVARNFNGILGLQAYSPTSKVIDIPNGWNTERFRIILMIDVIPPVGAARKKIMVQGYTDGYGVARGYQEAFSPQQRFNMLDPNMNIYINSITEIGINFNRYTGAYSYHMGETYNTLQDYVSKYNYGENNNLVLIRPKDVLGIGGVMFAQSGHSDVAMVNQQYHGYGDYTPHKCEASLRKNLDPSNYFSRLINGYLGGQAISSISYDDTDMDSVYTKGVDIVSEPVLLNNTFISRLTQILGDYNTTCLSLGHLVQIDPTLPHSDALAVFHNDDMGEVIRLNPELGTHDTQTTIQPTPRNIQILELNNSITSLLTTVGLSQVTFSLDTFTPVPTIIVMHAESLLGSEFVPECCENFKRLVELQILPRLTYNGAFQYQLTVHCDIMKDTTISITEEGDYLGPKEVFRFPTFADSLYSPMISTQDDRQVLLSGFDTIQERVL